MKSLIFLAYLCLSFSNPIEEVVSHKEQMPLEVFSLAPSLSGSVSKFSTELFQLVEKRERGRNIVIAPFSIHMAITLLFSGADGEARTEMATVLGIEDGNESDMQQEVNSIMTYYDKFQFDPSTQIEFANILFVDNKIKIKEDYISVMTEKYLSEVQPIDYSNTVESVEVINSWVSNKTNNLIRKLVTPDSIRSDTRLMLMNAIYFKVNWLKPFAKTYTKRQPFYVAHNLQVDAEMMFQENDILYKYDSDLKSQVISLFYENQNFTMLIILPDDNFGVHFLIEQIKTQNFNDLHKNLKMAPIYLRMPKFDIKYKTSLVRDLEYLGIQSIFSDELTNLSKISNEQLTVSEIVHEATLAVSEEGSEAAAVTAIEVDTRSLGPSPVPVIINRPFLFIILDIKNNIPKFIGKVANPTNQTPVPVSEDGIPGIQPNLIDVRSPIDNLVQLSFDPEASVHLQNFPNEYERPKICKEINEYTDTKTNQIIFPCNDTAPIEAYKKVHGDPSRFGINGEKASLAGEDVAA